MIIIICVIAGALVIMLLALCAGSSNESAKSKINDSKDLPLQKNTPSCYNDKFANSSFISMLASRVEATKAYGVIKKINCYPDKILIEYCNSQIGEKAETVIFADEGFDQYLSVEDCRLFWHALAKATDMEEAVCRYEIPDSIPYPEWNAIVDERGKRLQSKYHVSGLLVGDMVPK